MNKSSSTHRPTWEEILSEYHLKHNEGGNFPEKRRAVPGLY